jgi:cytochrome c553
VKGLVTPLGLATGVALCILAPAANQMLRAAENELTSAQSDYLEQCGDCHGIQGNTAPAPSRS